MRVSSLFFVFLLAIAGVAKADLVGDLFRSPATGIAFRPPADSVRVNAAAPGLIAEFDDADRHWVLKVTSVSLPHPLPLNEYKDQYGQSRDGLLDQQVAQLREQTGAEMVARDVVHIGALGHTEAGTLVIRCTQNAQRRLVQQGFVRANDQLYYVIELNTPAGDNSQVFSPTTGFPAINVPMGYSRGGTLPVGMTFYGRAWSEAQLIRLAYAYEQATRHRRPPVSTPPLR